ncbi:MAG: FkbM family methyltransferase [Polaromonas sp.]|nr:FkbM family methyltransferase [Polaromonas sp.]
MLNGILLSTINAKIVRAFPKTFSYRKNGTREGMDRLTVANNLNDVKSDIVLRSATSDWFTFDQIFIHEDYNLKALKRYPEFEALYAKYVAEGTPLILDLGANIGLSGVYFRHIWPASKIVAVEPSEDNFRVLRENFGKDNAFEALLAGIASQPSRLTLTDPEVEKNAFTTTVAAPGSEGGIEGVTVPEILARHPRSKGYSPFIVKIDIEGFESELFSGNTDWVNEFPVLIIEMHDWLFPGQQTSANFLKTISRLDRDFVYLGENVFSIRNDRSAAVNS